MDPSEVSTRDDFVRFIAQLERDLSEGASYWQNTDLGSFLDAIGYWMHNYMDEYYQRTEGGTPAPSWRLFAEILHVGAIRE